MICKNCDQPCEFNEHSGTCRHVEPLARASGCFLIPSEEDYSLTDCERALVDRIREICAREFDEEIEHPFFHLDREDGETIDRMLLRIYRAECDAQCVDPLPSYPDEHVVLVLCHG